MWIRLVGFRAVCESCGGARSLHHHHRSPQSLSLSLSRNRLIDANDQPNQSPCIRPSGPDHRPTERTNERTAGVMRTFQLINNRQELAFVRRFLRYLFANRWLMMGFMLPFPVGSGAGSRRKEAIRPNPASEFNETEGRSWGVLQQGCLKIWAF